MITYWLIGEDGTAEDYESTEVAVPVSSPPHQSNASFQEDNLFENVSSLNSSKELTDACFTNETELKTVVPTPNKTTVLASTVSSTTITTVTNADSSVTNTTSSNTHSRLSNCHSSPSVGEESVTVKPQQECGPTSTSATTLKEDRHSVGLNNSVLL